MRRYREGGKVLSRSSGTNFSQFISGTGLTHRPLLKVVEGEKTYIYDVTQNEKKNYSSIISQNAKKLFENKLTFRPTI